MRRKYLHQALKGHNHVWRYFVVSILAFVGYFAGLMPLKLVMLRIEYDDNGIDTSQINEFAQSMDFSLLGLSKNTGFLLTLFVFIFAMIFLISAFAIFHKRSYTSLLTAANRFRWKRFLFGFLFWILMTAIAEYVLYSLSPEHYTFSFEPNKFVWLLLMSVFLLPIQTSFEEVFFRGYLMQGLGSFLTYPIFALFITSFAFAAVHGSNPEIVEFGLGIMMVYYIGAGLLLGLVTLMDDGLELALGMHFAINFFGAVFMGYEGAAIQTDSVFNTSALNVNHMVIAFTIMAVIFVLICNSLFKWKSWKYLTTDLSKERSILSKANTLNDDLSIDYATILNDE